MWPRRRVRRRRSDQRMSIKIVYYEYTGFGRQCQYAGSFVFCIAEYRRNLYAGVKSKHNKNRRKGSCVYELLCRRFIFLVRSSYAVASPHRTVQPSRLPSVRRIDASPFFTSTVPSRPGRHSGSVMFAAIGRSRRIRRAASARRPRAAFSVVQLDSGRV